MASKIQGKLAGRDFLPKRLLGLAQDVTTLHLGTLLGAATGVSSGTMPNGDPYTGLVGAFEYTDHDTSIAPKASGRLFLPESIQVQIQEAVEAMKADEKDTGIRANVKFALKVGVQRAQNPAGYEWWFEPIGEIGVSDPLAELRAQLPKPEAAPAIENKAKAKAA